MTHLSATAQAGVASTVKKTFSRSTTIHQHIAADYARWNSTIVSIEGQIGLGEKIQLKSTLDPSRTFKLKVKEWIPQQKLVWGDGLGQRTYLLKVQESGLRFTMTKKIGGLMFPLFASKIPPFDESFEQFTADLKREAEAQMR